MQLLKNLMRVIHLIKLTSLLLASLVLVSCQSNSINGSVEGETFDPESGFYTILQYENTSFYVVVLTDIINACETLTSTSNPFPEKFGLLHLWLDSSDIQIYPVYSSKLLETDAKDYSLSYFMSVINDTIVVDEEGVAGLVELTDVDMENEELKGVFDIIFSGNDNRIQGKFSVEYCAIDWSSMVGLLY